MGTVWSGATAACAFAPGYLALLLGRIGIGVGQAGFGPAGLALLAASFPAERRATVLGVFQVGAPVGLVTGAVVGSLVSAHWGWRAAFLAVALPGLVLALLALRLRDYRSVPEPSRGRAAAVMLGRARSALGAMVGGALLLVIFSTLYTWLPTHLERAYGCRPPVPASWCRRWWLPGQPGRRCPVLSPIGSPAVMCGGGCGCRRSLRWPRP